MFICPTLSMKYPFWANLIQRSKIVCLRWNSVPRLEYTEVDGDIQIFSYDPEINFQFLDKTSPKIQNCLFKVKSSLDYLKFAEFADNVYFYCFGWEISF